MLNAMTVDVEDYFQVSAFERHLSRQDWDKLPCRVENNLDKILGSFTRHNVKATFFTLGWLAKRYPAMIRRIVDEGHELACHGYAHVRITDQTPEQFYAEVKQAKALLEDIAGVPMKGFRAASYSIVAKTLWAHEILQDLGFAYSSSIYPVHHDLYGMPEAPRFAFRPGNAPKLLEIPVTTFVFGGGQFPCGGGGYFRLFPYALSRWAINRVNRLDRQAAVFYFHPWELDPGQPRVDGIDVKTRFRHYLNLHRMEDRLERLLQDFAWSSMARVFLDAGQSPPCR